MSEKNYDIVYTAQDIEKYRKGLLSSQQMHAMEKAALDDPFLSDAMEGYQETDIPLVKDLADLQQRLAARAEQQEYKKAIPIGGSSSRTWLRAAAMIIAIAGAGLLIYQFAFNNTSSKEIALAPAKEEQPQLKAAEPEKQPLNNGQSKDSIATTAPAPLTGTNWKGTADAPVAKDYDSKAQYKTDPVHTEADMLTKDNTASTPAVAEKVIIAKEQEEMAAGKKTEPVSTFPHARNAEPLNKQKALTAHDDTNRSMNAQYPQGGAEAARNTERANNNQAFYRNNQFRGQVRDAQNNALPFANITNTRDNVGTYSDAQGYFALISPDTVLNVQVRSLGYESSTQQLRNNVSNNQIILQDDRKSMAEVVISNKKVNSTRQRDQHLVLDEPEPADGWANYDVYLANNLNAPESFKSKEGANSIGEVELSFEVNKNGEPINIKIEKSLCDKCDKEAIRLVKEGPKWKRKVKKGRTTVKVPF